MSPNPALARLGRFARAARGETVARPLVASPVADEYHLLALNVMAMLEELGERTLAVFTARDADRRSRISLNLGVALAQHADVALVGTNWSDPDVMWALSGPERPEHRLFVLSDRRALAPGRGTIADLEPVAQDGASGQYVVLDASLAERSSDAYRIAQKARNALYVLPGDATELETHWRQIAQLRRLNVNVLGVVVDEN